jgi:hypothetical protein
MTNMYEGIFWILVGSIILFIRIRWPFPKWEPDIGGTNGKLTIGGITLIVIGILMIIGEAKPIISSIF